MPPVLQGAEDIYRSLQDSTTRAIFPSTNELRIVLNDT